MKLLFLVGNILFTAPPLPLKYHHYHTLQLNFNDKKQRTVSYDLVQYIPTITAIQATTQDKSRGIDFTIISSEDWDLISPFLPLVKVIQVSPKERDYGYHSFHLDKNKREPGNNREDNMALLFLHMEERLKNMESLLQVLQIAHFLEIQEIYDLSKFLLLKKIKESKQFESLVQQAHKIPLDIQQDIIDIIYFYESKKIKAAEVKHRYSEEYKTVIKSIFGGTYSDERHLRFTYSLDNTLLKIREKEMGGCDSPGCHVFHIRYHPPQIQVFDNPTGNLAMFQLLFLRHIKKKWQRKNLKKILKQSHNCWDTNIFECIEKGNPTHFRLINPKHCIQVCKHTYPHAFEVYNSLDPNSFFLKATTTTANCELCTSKPQTAESRLLQLSESRLFMQLLGRFSK